MEGEKIFSHKDFWYKYRFILFLKLKIKPRSKLDNVDTAFLKSVLYLEIQVGASRYRSGKTLQCNTKYHGGNDIQRGEEPYFSAHIQRSALGWIPKLTTLSLTAYNIRSNAARLWPKKSKMLASLGKNASIKQSSSGNFSSQFFNSNLLSQLLWRSVLMTKESSLNEGRKSQLLWGKSH